VANSTVSPSVGKRPSSCFENFNTPLTVTSKSPVLPFTRSTSASGIFARI